MLILGPKRPNTRRPIRCRQSRATRSIVLLTSGANEISSLADASAYVTITTPAGLNFPLVLTTVSISAGQVSVSLPVTTLEALVPASQVPTANLQFAFVAANARATQAAIPNGANYFDPQTQSYVPFPQSGLPQGWDANARTLVLVPDVVRTVESAFPASTVQQIASQGGYINSANVPQVIGFDYDWLQGRSTSGAALSAFLNQLTTLTDGNGNAIRDLDMEGSGNGGIVVLAGAAHFHGRGQPDPAWRAARRHPRGEFHPRRRKPACYIPAECRHPSRNRRGLQSTTHDRRLDLRQQWAGPFGEQLRITDDPRQLHCQ